MADTKQSAKTSPLPKKHWSDAQHDIVVNQSTATRIRKGVMGLTGILELLEDDDVERAMESASDEESDGPRLTGFERENLWCAALAIMEQMRNDVDDWNLIT